MERRQWIADRLIELDKKFSTFATESGVSESTAARWLSGECVPSPRNRRRMAKSLRISLKKLNARLAEERSENCVRTIATKAPDGDPLKILRRDILVGPLSLLIVNPKNGRAPKYLDPSVVTGLAATASTYRRAYLGVAASALLPAAMAHMNLALSTRQSTKSKSDQSALLGVAGEMATLTGVLLAIDARRLHEAVPYFALAWKAAMATEDEELQAVILGCQGLAFSYNGQNQHKALEYADIGSRIGTNASSETRGWVAAVASERCAELGDVKGCMQRLEDSQKALSSAQDAGVWRGIGGFGVQKLRAYEGGDLLRLERYREAEKVLRQALSDLDESMPRHRATALLDHADAYLGMGEVEAACSDALIALELSTEVQHSGHLERIASVAERGVSKGCSGAQRLLDMTKLAKIEQDQTQSILT